MKIVRYQTDTGDAAFGILVGSTVYATSGDVFDGLTKGEEVGDVEGVSPGCQVGQRAFGRRRLPRGTSFRPCGRRLHDAERDVGRLVVRRVGM